VSKVGRLEKILISLSSVLFWISALSGVVLLLDYSLDVSKRQSRGGDCVWDLVEKEKNFPYVARYCYLTKNTAMLRLYDDKEEVLLAERMFFEMDYVMLNWTGDKLIYSNSEFDFISLPPTWIDRLRAKLP
jgi:hypothetical protein